MIVSQDDARVLVAAPAKVNLHLEVLGKRPDGYHELETLLVTVSLHDHVEVRRSSGSAITLACDEPTVPTGPANLVWRAAELMRQRAGRDDGLSLTLTKRIPMEAGLAGGSTDAAATLLAISRLWGLGWSRERLAELGAELGSDIPFFFHGPAAVARGRGERLERVRLGRPLHLVLVCPGEGVSTAKAFGKVTLPAHPASIEPLLIALQRGDVGDVARRLHNRLQEASATISGAVAELADQARNWPCLAAMMSGSGSAFFAVCADASQAQQLGHRLRAQRQDRVFVVRSSS